MYGSMVASPDLNRNYGVDAKGYLIHRNNSRLYYDNGLREEFRDGVLQLGGVGAFEPGEAIGPNARDRRSRAVNAVSRDF